LRYLANVDPSAAELTLDGRARRPSPLASVHEALPTASPRQSTQAMCPEVADAARLAMLA
jgi:hypothetical protein